MAVPQDTDYNPVSNTTPAGIVGFSPELGSGDIAGIEGELNRARFIYGVGLHEIGHVLGIGTSERWFHGLHVVLGPKHIDRINERHEATDSVDSQGDTVYVRVADTTWGSWWCDGIHVPPDHTDDVCGTGRAKQRRMATFWDPPDDSTASVAFREFLSHQPWAGDEGRFDGRLFPTTNNGFFYHSGDTAWASYHFHSCLGPPQVSIVTGRGWSRSGPGLPQDVMLGGFYRGQAGWRWYRPLITLLTANALQGFQVDLHALDWQEHESMLGCPRMMTPADSALLFYPSEEYWTGEVGSH